MSENYSKNNNRLPRKEVISKLDSFLEVIKNDYSHLWEGNPSPINEYGGAQPTYFGMRSEFATNSEFNMFVPLKTLSGKFGYLGIVKEGDKFKFYLESLEEDYEFQLCESGEEVYNILETELDLGEENFITHSGKRIYSCLEDILKRKLDAELKNTKDKLGV